MISWKQVTVTFTALCHKERIKPQVSQQLQGAWSQSSGGTREWRQLLRAKPALEVQSGDVEAVPSCDSACVGLASSNGPCLS